MDDELLSQLAAGTVEDPPPASVDEAARAAYRRRSTWRRRHPVATGAILMSLMFSLFFFGSDCMEGCASPAVASRHLIFGCPTPKAPREP